MDHSTSSENNNPIELDVLQTRSGTVQSRDAHARVPASAPSAPSRSGYPSRARTVSGGRKSLDGRHWHSKISKKLGTEASHLVESLATGTTQLQGGPTIMTPSAIAPYRDDDDGHNATINGQQPLSGQDGPSGSAEHWTLFNPTMRDHSAIVQGRLDSTAMGESQRLTPYLVKLSLVAGCSGLLFGWDTGICAGMLVAIKGDLGHSLSAKEQEMVVSATTVGAIFGSLIAGKAADWLGRKRVITIAACLFLLGSLEQTASNDVPQLILGRFIVGVAVGQAATVVPMYLAEVAPTTLRGRIVGTNSLLITGGQVVAYLVNAALFPVAHGWRWMVLISALPAVVQLIGLLSLDESPRWLVHKGRYVQARRVLKKIYPLATPDMIESEVDRIQKSLRAMNMEVDDDSQTPGQVPQWQVDPANGCSAAADDEEGDDRMAVEGHRTEPLPKSTPTFKKRSKWSLLFHEPHNRRALILAAGLQAFQQATGFNALMYYSSRLLLIAGPPFDRNPNGFATLIAIANFIGTCVAMRFVDSWGRRKLLLWTTAAMGLTLVMLAGSFAAIGDTGTVTDPALLSANGTIANSTAANPTPSSIFALRQAGVIEAASKKHAASHVFAILSLFLMILFTLSYALGQGIVPWLVLSEAFAGQVRSLGSGLASCANWSVNLLWSATYLSLVEAVGGPAGTFAIFAVIAGAAWTFAWWMLPELKDVSINDVGRAFAQNGSRSERYGEGDSNSLSRDPDATRSPSPGPASMIPSAADAVNTVQGLFSNQEEEAEEDTPFVVEDDEEVEDGEGGRQTRPTG